MTRSLSRRERQAIQTRNDILDAALRLFVRHGYGATSVADIAAEAGVAVPTIYASIGTKASLLVALVDRMDERAEIGPLVERLESSEDPVELITMEVAINRRFAERVGDEITVLASASTVEPELGKLYAEGMARHRHGSRLLATRLDGLGALRPHVTVDRAVAIIVALTHHTTYATLTRDFGWSFDECQTWLVETLAGQLLVPARRPRAGARTPGGGSGRRDGAQ